MYSKLLPDNSDEKRNYLIYAATECLEGLRCHKSIASLESREQYYECVYCVYKLSQVCQELTRLPAQYKIMVDDNLSSALSNIAFLLYEHYCSLEMKFQHSDWSSKLIRATLQLLALPEIPSAENVQIPRAVTKIHQAQEPEKGMLGRKAIKKIANPVQVSEKSSRTERPTALEGSPTAYPVSLDISSKTTLEDGGSYTENMQSMKAEYLDQMRIAETISTDDESSARETTDSGFRDQSTVIETEDMNGSRQTTDDKENSELCLSFMAASTEDSIASELESKRKPRIQELIVDRMLAQENKERISPAEGGGDFRQRSTTQSGYSAECSETKGRISLREEETWLTSESEGIGSGIRLQETMATLEERRTADVKGKDIEDMLNAIKHTKKKRVHSKYPA